MPAKTLNDFLAGFFMAKSKPIWRLRWRLQGRATGGKVIEGRVTVEKVKQKLSKLKRKRTMNRGVFEASKIL
jgi:hypothetical protein